MGSDGRGGARPAAAARVPLDAPLRGDPDQTDRGLDPRGAALLPAPLSPRPRAPETPSRGAPGAGLPHGSPGLPGDPNPTKNSMFLLDTTLRLTLISRSSGAEWDEVSFHGPEHTCS